MLYKIERNVYKMNKSEEKIKTAVKIREKTKKEIKRSMSF